MTELDRQQLLKRAAGVAAGAVLAETLPWQQAASAGLRARRLPADLRQLAALLDGPVIARGAPRYDSARLLYNPRFDAIKPRAIAVCETVRDVERTVVWAKRHGVRIAARSGGHSYGGYSATEGVVIDLSRLSGIAVDKARQRVVIGAGALLTDIYAELWKQGLTIPSGTCGTVGISGIALGGGYSALSRKHGLTCDNVEALTIVTAAGHDIRCSPNAHKDLYWASRGGGGGNFGVATSFTLRTHAIGRVGFFFVSWPWERAAAALDAWQRWAPHTPDELFSTCNVSARSTVAPPEITASGVFIGTEAELRKKLQPLIDAVSPSSMNVVTRSYIDVVKGWSGCPGQDACHNEKTQPGASIRESYRARSDYVAKPMPKAGLEAIVRQCEQRPAAAGPGYGGLLLDAYGGAINRVAPSATAFVHRRQLFSIQYLAYWGTGSSAATAQANDRWQRQFHTALRPYVSGYAYQNYIDPDLAGWERAYYGANYPRLRAVKRAYDPGQLFRFKQSIRP